MAAVGCKACLYNNVHILHVPSEGDSTSPGGEGVANVLSMENPGNEDRKRQQECWQNQQPGFFNE